MGNIKHDAEYLRVLQKVINEGEFKEPARLNMPRTKSVFVEQMRFDLRKGFPLLTSKKMFTKGMIAELLWFLLGNTNVKYLDNLGVTKFWHQDAYRRYCKLYGNDMTFAEWCKALSTCEETNPEWADCGPIYGYQWRNFNSSDIDQIANVIKSIMNSPTDRYKVVSAWNPVQMHDMALPPCHMLFQFNCAPLTLKERLEILLKTQFDDVVDYAILPEHELLNVLDAYHIPKYWLDCALTQRSCDMCLGVPINIASYSLLTHIIARITNTEPRYFVWTGNDVHIYEHHIETAKLQLQTAYAESPTLLIDSTKWEPIYVSDKESLTAYSEALTKLFASISIDDFHFENYMPAKTLTFELFTGLKQ